MKALRELKQLLSELEASKPSPDFTESTMLRVRKILEARAYRGEFVHLHFFCHWVVHASLHDSPLIYKWLTVASDAAIGLFNGRTNPAECIKVGATILNLDGLRAQLRSLLARERLDTFLADSDDYWYCFVQGLLACIYETPIGVPEVGQGNAKAHERAQKYLAQYSAAPDKPFLDCIRTIEVFVQDNKFKVILRSQGRFEPLFTVANMYPFMEFDAMGLATSPWAETVDLVMTPPLVHLKSTA